MGICLRALVAFGLFLCACDAEEGPAAAPAVSPAAAPVAAQPEVPVAQPEAPTEPAELTDAVDDPTFALALKPAGPYESGKLGSFVISIEPRGEYHMNEDYPTGITVKGAPELSFPKAQLGVSDAAAFEQKVARFEVPFTAAKAGEHRVECNVKFAICTEDNCIPEERTLALALPVK